ncbi:hypothetical protein [Luteibacter sp. SG786]|uniref:hypothetical protein n=1 Tax=Luteibacter sp. SG786 TaxID=2587130 RepID=UPI00141F6677|nr:hypothetical protein [Luteibacter sp. SG786]NII53596.1 hypothetical protein [Luteibacter sp. SG786]
MALTIQRINFDPVTGDNPSEGFMKTELNIVEIATAIDGDGTPGNPGIEGRLADVEAVADGLGSASTRNVGTTAGTVAAGDDARLLRVGRNLFINGGGRIKQRVFAGGAMAANVYGYDRWRTFGAAASFTRAADMTTLTLNGTIGQIVEAPLAGATVTVSVSNPTGPITVNIRPDATTAGVNGVIPAGAGLQSVTLVVPGSITGNVFVQLTTSAPVSFDGWAKRGGIQLELGSFASAFDVRPIGYELALCQRYCCKSFDPDVDPQTNLAGGTGNQATHIAAGLSTAAARTEGIPFPVNMRAQPTITPYTNSSAPSQGNNWAIFTSQWFTVPVAFTAGASGFSATLTPGSGLVQASAYTVAGNWLADAEL